MLIDKVKNTIKKYKLLCKGDRVVIGVSGGPDSLTLLYILNGLKKELNLRLHVAHLDHMLRKDSARDKKFVEALARRWNLSVTASRINVKKLAKKGSIEEIARNCRLNFLCKVAKKIKANKIALGHNLDDQAETVLMRIIRGTGLYGLSGILPKRIIYGYEVIRPLIEIRRREIESFLKKRDINPRIDKSNTEEIYFRNKIRNKLLPLLENEYNQNIKEVLSNTAENVAYDYEYLGNLAHKAMKTMKRKISLKKFHNLHPSIQRLVLRFNIARLKGDTRAITFKHIQEIEDLVLNRPINSVVDLPKNISVIKKPKNIFFYRRKKQ
jgi:tRNA(Ile)-lysidine synthase